MNIFVLAHTHWDREWFVTHEYTDELLEDLFENLMRIFDRKKDFVYILDGQTLVIEDLLKRRPDLEDKIRELISNGRLIVGPVYAQLDWRISPPQAIWKDFSIGVKDSRNFGKIPKFAWFMDNFGHVSQIPQILNAFGIDWVFLWRGVRLDTGRERMYLNWSSPDGSSVKTVFLLGGYRNLYNLVGTPEIVHERFEHELEKVKHFTDVPILFDGYDLDTHPEDPRDFLDVSVDPEDYLETLESVEKPIDVEGELISGKYACTFPGTLSTRTYLKIGADHVAKLLSYLSLFGEDEDGMWRDYLKTLIHDNISGVCVDQVHEEMEKIYSDLCEKARQKLEDVLSRMNLKGFYVFNPSSFEYHGTHATREKVFKFDVGGTGIWRIGRIWNWKESRRTDFENEFLLLKFDGKNFRLNGKKIGILRVERELGDTYSSHTEPIDFEVDVKSIRFFESEASMKIEMERTVRFDGGFVESKETILLDSSPLVRWRIEIHPQGVDYKLRIGREVDAGKIVAGMPFDEVEREPIDTDLLPEEIEPPLSSVLLAARETGKVVDFPFQNFVSVGNGHVLARGLREYSYDGILWITLLRSVEWLTRKAVPGRVGDAGPEMYVPGARCERRTIVDLAFMDLDGDPTSWIELFSKFPVIFNSHGERTVDVPLFKVERRWFLKEGEHLITLKGKKIERLRIDYDLPFDKRAEVEITTDLDLPFDRDRSKPDTVILKRMENEISKLEKRIEELERELPNLKGLDFHERKHELLSLKRKVLEMRLSLKLNLGDENLPSLVRDLNEARRERRTYDYVLELYRTKG